MCIRDSIRMTVMSISTVHPLLVNFEEYITINGPQSLKWSDRQSRYLEKAGGPFMPFELIMESPEEIVKALNESVDNPRLFSGMSFSEDDIQQGVMDLMSNSGNENFGDDLRREFKKTPPPYKSNGSKKLKYRLDDISKKAIIDDGESIEIDLDQKMFGAIASIKRGDETFEIRNVVHINYSNPDQLELYSIIHQSVITAENVSEILIEPEMVPVVSPVFHKKDNLLNPMDLDQLGGDFTVREMEFV